MVERSFLAGKNIRLEWTKEGTRIHAVVPPQVAGPPASAIQWKGEWNAATAYKENDLVIRGSANPSSANATDARLLDGVTAGLYIALRNMEAGESEPTEPPPAGDWDLMARFATPIFTVTTGPGSTKIVLNGRAPNGSVAINLADCNGKALSIREVAVCVNGVEKKMMVLGSSPY